MTQVGRRITLLGLIVQSKSALTIAYGEGQIDLSGVSTARVNELINLGCHTAVRVSGTLQYYPEPGPQKATVIPQQRSPEHFYFSAPRIEVVRVEKRVKSKPKKG